MLKYTCFLLILFFVSPICGEYTTGVRTWLGANVAFGKIGAYPVSATPDALPFILGDKNTATGFELFGEISLTRELYLEPHFGILNQKKFIRSSGIETNLNGKAEKSDNIYASHESNNIAFGLSLVGKTPGLSKTFRFSASFGLQFLRASKNQITYFSVKNIINESGQVEESKVASDTSAIAGVKGEINPWGMRVLSGFGIDYIHGSLGGVVIQMAMRFGFDLSYLIFQQDSIKNAAVQHAQETNNTTLSEVFSDRIKKTYFEFSGGMYLGVSYRLPIGDLSGSKKMIPKRRPKEVDEEE